MSADGPVDLVRQGELEQEIVRGINSAMSEIEGWIMLNCFFTQAGTCAEGVIDWYRPDLTKGTIPVSSTAIGSFVNLRDAMWNPDSRPWLSVHVQGNSAGTFSFSFNYERRFDITARYKNAFELTPDLVPTDADLRTDLELFPRASEMVPGWYPHVERPTAAVGTGHEEPLQDGVESHSAITSQQAALIDRGKTLLESLAPNAGYEFELWPDDQAVYVWQLGFGVGQIVVGVDGSLLFGNSTLWRDPMLELWRSGKRTPSSDFPVH